MIPDSKSVISYKVIILGVLVIVGIILYQLGFFEERFFIEIGERHLKKWWFIPLVILSKALLYAFALPGSVMYVVAGLFYEPLHATLIIAAGGVSGAIGAYYLSRTMSKEARKRIQSSKAFSVMQRHSDFATLSAVRTLPGFPHSIINYGAGILNIPMGRFIISAIIGFSAKGFLYASAIHQATRIDDYRESDRFEMFMPLIALALLFILGKMVGKKLSK